MWRMVSGAWRTMTASLPVVGLVVALQIGFGLASLPFAGQVDPNRLSVGEIVLALLLVLINFFLFPLIQSGYLSVAQARAMGSSASPLVSFREGIRQLYVRLLGLEALITAVMTVGGVLVGVVAIMLAQGVTRMGEPLGIATALLLLVPVAAVLYLLILIGSMAPVAICVERLGVVAAIRRGLAVGRASVGALMLTNLLALLTLSPAFLLFGLLVAGMDAAAVNITLAAAVTILLQSLLMAVSTLLFVAVWLAVFRRHTAPAGFSQTT